jgi:hypothetical protein
MTYLIKTSLKTSLLHWRENAIFIALIYLNLQARSSVVEHHLDMVVVGGSIPLVPTNWVVLYATKAGYVSHNFTGWQ